VPNTRDARGRFLKGTTGNPKGRPPKISLIESSDFELFRGTMVEIDNPRGGRKKILTREGAIQERLYASAMKGNVQAQIFLSRKFQEAKEALAESQARLRQIENRLNTEGYKPTDEERAAARMLRIALNLDPNPGWKIKRARPSRAKENPTAAGDAPSSSQRPSKPENRSGPPPSPKPAKPSK